MGIWKELPPVGGGFFFFGGAWYNSDAVHCLTAILWQKGGDKMSLRFLLVSLLLNAAGSLLAAIILKAWGG